MSLTDPLLEDASGSFPDQSWSEIKHENREVSVSSSASTAEPSPQDTAQFDPEDRGLEPKLANADALLIHSIDDKEVQAGNAPMPRALLSPLGSPQTTPGVVMAFAGVACACTALFMQESLVALIRRGIPLPDYPDLAREAVGSRFAVLAHVVALVEIFGYVSANLIALANGLVATVPALSEPQAMLVSTSICVGFAAISDKQFAYCALISSSAMAAIFATVLLWGTELDTWAEPTTFLKDSSYVPASFAVVIFTAGAHPLLPCVMHSTRSRAEFRSAIRLSWTFFSLFAILSGGLAFYMYGHSLQPLITDNLGRNLELMKMPGGGAMRKTGGLWVLVKLFGSTVPSTRPPVVALGKQIGIRLPAGNGGFSSVLLTAPLLYATAVLSQIISPYIATFESVIGCVITSFNALLFPSLTYLVICQPKDIEHRICARFFLLLGALLPFATMLPRLLECF
ncbi:unnamed protein product [Cladocopium goreaui]|uniref:Amino acid transporter transmembrane domain-containing protein n=1 Tax=Cladocopium goreaui TaxID=2562237 RepID=A0A9P1CB50_9DINO|nr:unnamed protein product [Cladocopium goreaui]